MKGGLEMIKVLQGISIAGLVAGTIVEILKKVGRA